MSSIIGIVSILSVENLKSASKTWCSLLSWWTGTTLNLDMQRHHSLDRLEMYDKFKTLLSEPGPEQTMRWLPLTNRWNSQFAQNDFKSFIL